MERCLRPGRTPSLAGEFPLIFDERFSGRVVAYIDGGDVRSTCAIIVREMLFEGVRMRVGMIGSVATQPAWRGRGLASTVLDEAEACLAREGCAISFLWADDPDFYAGRGYGPFGWEVDFLVPAAVLRPIVSEARIRTLVPDDTLTVQRLYMQNVARVDRTLEETAALLACPGMETLVLQHQSVVRAYACLGRGADFQNTVHEWGGEAEDVVALLAEHARRSARAGIEDPIALIAPPDASALRKRLTDLGAQVVEGVLAMAKPLDTRVLAELLGRFGGEWRAEQDRSPGSHSAVVLRGPSGRLALSGDQVMETLFAARGERTAIAKLEHSLGSLAPKLPLAPFIWGLDSI